MPPPAQLTTLFATDESIAVRAPDDFWALCPRDQQICYGTDGAIAAASPWVLTSATVNFSSLGVQPNMMLLLAATGYKPLGGAGVLLAVDSVSAGTVTLRRKALVAGMGTPPAPASGQAAITFECRTLQPQIEEVTYDVMKDYGIDANNPYHTQADMTDIRDVRRLVVLEVLMDRYTDAQRGSATDFAEKIKHLTIELETLRERVRVRWGPTGVGDAPSTPFGRHVSR